MIALVVLALFILLFGLFTTLKWLLIIAAVLFLLAFARVITGRVGR
jgi:hypothetical protein